MNTILFIGSVLVYVLQGLVNKKCSIILKERNCILIFNLIRTFICSIFALLVLLIMRQPLKINAQTCLISIVSATAIALSFFSSLVVLRDGTVVLAQIFSTAGLIVPCLAGRFLFDEKISYVQFGGLIVLMFASSLMVTHNRDVSRWEYIRLFFFNFQYSKPADDTTIYSFRKEYSGQYIA